MVDKRQGGNNEIDVWGFRIGTRNSFLMQSLETGGKSKETIRSEFLQAYPNSEGTSTFGVFFTDVVRQFGSASVSRSIRIETNVKGHVRLDMRRAELVKAAIARGLLKEVSALEKGKYPKRDFSAIEEILHRFRLPLKQ